METSRIREVLDNRIIDMINSGTELCVVQSELYNKANKFCAQIKQDKTIDLYKLLSKDENTIYPVRVKYQVTYIKHCLKRIKDIDWIEDNKNKFKNFNIRSEKKLFKLLKFKEQLSIENSLPF